MRFMGSPPESLPRSIPGRDVRSLVETAVLRRGWDADEAMLEAEAKAERIIAEELKRRKWREADLAKRAKGDPAKVALAGRLRAETTVTVQWIATRLHMGTAGYLNNRLYRWRKGMLKKSSR